MTEASATATSHPPGGPGGGASHRAEAGPIADPDDARRFLVCGDTPLTYRLADELTARYGSAVAVIVPTRRGNWAPQIAQLPGVTLVVADRLDAEAFGRAGLAQAAAVALVAQDDVGNVDAALIAQELNPGVRIVIRMFNLGLGENIAQLLDDCVVLSAAAIAAPALVAAALDDSTTPPVAIAGRTLVATRRDRAATGDIVCGLAVTEGRAEPETLPPDDADADLVLAGSQPAHRLPVRHRRNPWRILLTIVSTRLRLALAAIILVLLTGTGVLAWVKQVTLPQAAYIAFLTELGGADADPAAPALEKLALAVLSVVSIALIPLLTAALVEAVVNARLTLAHGGPVGPIADHIVVVGLGDVGSRVTRSLHEQGFDVVCVERSEQARGLPVASAAVRGDRDRAVVAAGSGADGWRPHCCRRHPRRLGSPAHRDSPCRPTGRGMVAARSGYRHAVSAAGPGHRRAGQRRQFDLSERTGGMTFGRTRGPSAGTGMTVSVADLPAKA